MGPFIRGSDYFDQIGIEKDEGFERTKGTYR